MADRPELVQMEVKHPSPTPRRIIHRLVVNPLQLTQHQVSRPVEQEDLLELARPAEPRQEARTDLVAITVSRQLPPRTQQQELAPSHMVLRHLVQTLIPRQGQAVLVVQEVQVVRVVRAAATRPRRTSTHHQARQFLQAIVFRRTLMVRRAGKRRQ